MNSLINRNPYNTPLVIGLAHLANIQADDRLSLNSRRRIKANLLRCSIQNKAAFSSAIVKATGVIPDDSLSHCFLVDFFRFPLSKAPRECTNSQRQQEAIAREVFDELYPLLDRLEIIDWRDTPIKCLLQMLPVLVHGISATELTSLACRASANGNNEVIAIVLEAIDNTVKEVKLAFDDQLPRKDADDIRNLFAVAQSVLLDHDFPATASAVRLLGTLGIATEELKQELAELSVAFMSESAYSEDQQMDLSIAALSSYRQIWSDDQKHMEFVFDQIQYANDDWREEAAVFFSKADGDSVVAEELLGSFDELMHSQPLAVVGAQSWLVNPVIACEQRIAALEKGARCNFAAVSVHSVAALASLSLFGSQGAADVLIDLVDDGFI